MTIRDFRYLIAVADCLNFHEAARRCHVTQSTLSIQLRKLEGYLGAECFERNRGGVRVTPAGRELVRHARDLLESFERMRRIGATFKRMHEQEQAAVPVSGFSCA
ncbi:MAG: LysR family transcriptional regulator [Metallibacterium scheffleri]|nr:LysR family transcriptional regulator [Metallibacterium scheffleri]